MEIQLWREILNPYDLAVKELTVKFEHLIQEHRQQGLYSPIEQVHGRVKTISSILDKAQKKNIPDEPSGRHEQQGDRRSSRTLHQNS